MLGKGVYCTLVLVLSLSGRLHSSAAGAGLIGVFAGNRECEGGSRTIVCGCPQPATVGFDNRAADREPDPHTIGLRGVERFEEPVADCRIKASSGVLDSYEHTFVDLLCAY